MRYRLTLIILIAIILATGFLTSCGSSRPCLKAKPKMVKTPYGMLYKEQYKRIKKETRVKNTRKI